MAIWMPKQTAMTPSMVTMKASIIAEAELLHPQDQKHVERGQDHADLERNAEQEIEPDRRADHLGEIGGADGKLGERPERIGDPAREGVAAGLRQVAAATPRRAARRAPAG